VVEARPDSIRDLPGFRDIFGDIFGFGDMFGQGSRRRSGLSAEPIFAKTCI